jgi:8-oxo-dGTP pyrophosphatase MutT (NUDIX family)
LPDVEADVIVTRRSARLNRHSGQFALPGGRLDAGETAVDAALRETAEEIGLLVDVGDVVGQLDDLVTRSGFVITPVVVWAGIAKRLMPDPVEVESVFRIPLVELDGAMMPDIVKDHDSGLPVMSGEFPTVGGRIFAPTAAILFQFREVALHGRRADVSGFGQPEFTRR